MTKKQMSRFWPVFAKACDELGLECAEEREQYRHEVMWEADRSRHLADVSPTTGFERLISRVAADAGDYELAGQFAIGDARRMGAMIDDCSRQIIELTTGEKAAKPADRIAYVGGVLEKAGFSRIRINSAAWWMDYDIEKPVKVFQILDTHRRRLVKRRGNVQRGDLAYRFGKEYAA